MTDSQFLRTLERIHNGALLDTLDEEILDAVKGIRAAGGQATITLSVTVKAVGENRVEVSGSSKLKPAKVTHPSSIFYFNEANQLTRNDPRQAQLFAESDAL